MAGLAALGLLGVALMPWWFPWVLPSVAGWVGARYAGYERLSWDRFALRGLELELGGVEIRVGRMEAPLPAVWGWQRWRGGRGESGGNPRLDVSDWQVVIPSTATPEGEAASSGRETLDEVEAWVSRLRPWVRQARLGHGVVSSPLGAAEVPEAVWEGGALNARVRVPSQRQSVEVALQWPEGGMPEFRLQLRPGTVWVDGRLDRASGNWRGGGDLEWGGVSAKWQAVLGDTGWLPAEADVEVAEFRFPGERVGLTAYDWLVGSLRLGWKEGQFEGRVEATAEPEADRAWFMPEAHGVAIVHGNEREFYLDDLQVEAPWGKVRLSAPVGLDRTGGLLGGAAQLTVDVDLDEWPRQDLVGQLEGDLMVRGGSVGDAVWTLQLRGKDLGWKEHRVSRLALRALWERGEVRLERLDVLLPGDAQLDARGVWDLARQELRGGEWDVSGRPPPRYLPPGLSVGGWSGRGTVEGRVGAWRHTGQLSLGELELWGVSGVGFELEWSGDEDSLERCVVGLRRGETGVRLSGEAHWDGGTGVTAEWLLREAEVRLAQGALRLHEPATLRWREGTGPASWGFECERVLLQGAGRQIEIEGNIDWPGRGVGHGRVAGLGTEDLSGWLPGSVPAVGVDMLEAWVQWAGGVVELRGGGRGRVETDATGRLDWVLAGRSGASGIEVTQLDVNQGADLGVSVTGSVPVELAIGEAGLRWGWVPDRDFDLTGAVIGPGAAGRSWLGAKGAELRGVKVHWALAGSPAEPRLGFSGLAERAEVVTTNGWKIPAAERVAFRGGWDGERLRVADGEVDLQGQRVEFGLELPWQPWDEATGWARATRLDRGELTGSVRVPGVDLAGWSAYLPEMLEARGKLAAELNLRPGLDVQGTVSVSGVSTRPMGVLAPVRDVGLRLRLGDGAVALEEGRAIYLGGPLHVSGGGSWAGPTGLQFSFGLTGTNVPLVRRPGVIIRSDLDLRLARTNEAPPKVTGEVRIHDSLIVEDLDMLVPGTARPEDRPPYFRVESGPLRTWGLELALRSDRGVRVLSPLVRGEASANLRLYGSLGDPVLAGEVRLNSGKVSFPFGSLEVGFGSVTMTAENPSDPALLLNAAGNVSGYHVTLDLGGTVQHPEVMLVSSPPLQTQEILMMLASGQVPQGERRYSATEKLGYLGLFLGRDVLTRLGLSESSSERLILRSTRRSARDGRPTYEVEYRLTDDWSAIGQYDQYGGINGGIKWRIYSR